MKKIISIFTALLMMLSVAFSASALKHYGFHITMTIPDNFVEVEDDDASLCTYVDTYGRKQINIFTQYFDDVDFGKLSDSEISRMEGTGIWDSVFIPEGTDYYFTVEPKASKAYVNSYTGLKLTAQYTGPSLPDCEVFSTVYMFTENYDTHCIAFVAFDDSSEWYDECLDSLVLEEENSEDEDTTSSIFDTTAKSETGSENLFISRPVRVVIILGLAVYSIFKFIKNKKDI